MSEESNIKQMNPDGVNYLSWLMADVQNFRDCAYQLFGVSINLNETRTINMINAAKLYLSEIEDDVVKLKELLNGYSQ